VRMVPMYQDAKVYFSHPMGLVHDLKQFNDDDLIICDIAVDQRAYRKLLRRLEKIISKGYSITYFDHHPIQGELPPGVVFIHDTSVSATELVYRFYYHKLPKNASRIALIGAINDYLDDTPLMEELMYQYERRTLFLDAGILAQGLKDYRHNYDKMRKLLYQMSGGQYPCEVPYLVNKSLKVTRADKYTQIEVLKHYKTLKHIAWIKNPEASRSKAAHWIMGDSEKTIGITVIDHHSRKDIYDLTIRGRNLVNLLDFVPKIAKKMGGSGGGHPNACGCRIPKEKLEKFLQILDSTLGALEIPNGKNVESLIDTSEIIKQKYS